MKNNILIFFLAGLLLLGAGCAKEDFSSLTSDKVRQALYGAANELSWTGDVIEKPASDENHYGKSYVLSGPFKQEGQLDEAVVIDNIEIIEFANPALAGQAYGEEECFKGKGEPIKIYGMDGCCLNDRQKGKSSAVMMRDNYIFRAQDFFHTNCGAAEFLKSFWKNYGK
jgi:hypothetical protein